MQNKTIESEILQKRKRKGEIFQMVSIRGLNSVISCRCMPTYVNSPSIKFKKLIRINNIFMPSAPLTSMTKMTIVFTNYPNY